MGYSLQLTKVQLKNFIGIETGLGKTELTVDFTKLLNKNIICILGDNGTGKSTFSSVIHPLIGTTDKRSKFIIEDKEGFKKLWYARSDGSKYVCKVVYSPTKSGHTAKGFIKKTRPTGEEVELNPNGNITSYKEILLEEFGISEAFLKLASQNDVCKGHVDMTSTERKVNIATFLPDDIYSAPYAIVDKLYKELKMRINVLVDAIGKMHDDETLALELEKTTKQINELVEKRDKCIGKIKELETRIDIIRKEGILERADDSEHELNRLEKQLEKTEESINTVIEYLCRLIPNFDKAKLMDTDSLIAEYTKQNQDYIAEKSKLEALIYSQKERRNDLSDKVQKKSQMFSDLSTNKSLNELRELQKAYSKRYDELDKLLGTLDNSLTVNDFMVGYKIVEEVRNCISEICANYSSDIIDDYCENGIKIFEEESIKLNDEKAKCDNEVEELSARIHDLNKDSNLKNILDKRPKNCTIDDCPFIANAQKWVIIEKELDELLEEDQKVRSKLEKINARLEYLTDIITIDNNISSLFKYVQLNSNIVKKLPYSDAYDTFEKLVKALKKRGSNLSKCDDFEKFIEIIEMRDEYNDLKFIKIPMVENDIKVMETNGQFIEDTKNEIYSMKEEIAKIQDMLNEENYKLEYVIDKKDEVDDILEALKQIQYLYSSRNSLTESIAIRKDELDSYKNKIVDFSDYKESLHEKKDKLNSIESELQPLTRQRELYKMEQLKIADHKQELAVLNADMYKCEVVRAALSVKDDGIPIDALDYFMESIRTNANALLSEAFNGSLYLEEFIINTKDFIIPYKKNGISGLDVSFASSSERSFVSLALTLSIMEEIMSDKCYGTVILDEIDRGFASAAKYKFIEILDSEISRTNITQVFMVTHNSNFYEGHNIGYILFPGADISKVDESDCIRID